MSHVRLACIARDEAGSLPSLAEAVRDKIDSWIICLDPRTTDDTEKVAYREFKGIPGKVVYSELTEETFDFAAARNELMRHAKKYGAYLLLLDCDSPLIGEIPKKLTAPCYVCDIRDENDWAWKMPVLVRSDAIGEWQMPAHEYLTFNANPEEFEYLPQVYIRRKGAGTNEKRLRWTVDVLTKEMESGSINAGRACFFLANTLHSLGEIDEAIAHYIRRIGMDGSDEETFFALYRAGRLLQPRQVMKAFRAYMDAYGMRAWRQEPLFFLAEIANGLGEHQMALGFANQGLSLPPTTDTQFVERWVENWGMRLQWAFAAFNCSIHESHDVMRELLDRDDIPDYYRQALEKFVETEIPLPGWDFAMAGIRLGEGTISGLESDFLSHLVNIDGPVHVAETGFGKGRSAWSFLVGNKECTVTSFDIGLHEAVGQAKKVIDKWFPGRHKLILGDSKETVPANLEDWDMVFIDGGHDYESAMADLVNFAKPGRAVIYDDLLEVVDWAEGCLQAWNEATAPDGFIEPGEIYEDGTGHRWAVGRYK